MNKLLIVLLAVCLVSVHAFVKRDATEAAATPVSDMQKQIDDLKTKLEEFTKSITDEATKVLNPDAVKKSFEDAIEAAKQALDKLKPAGEAKPAA